MPTNLIGDYAAGSRIFQLRCPEAISWYSVLAIKGVCFAQFSTLQVERFRMPAMKSGRHHSRTAFSDPIIFLGHRESATVVLGRLP